METQVNWGLAFLLIALAAAPLAEESFAGFRAFLNTQWFDGNDNCPVTRFKSVLLAEIGLFLWLAFLAIFGAAVNAYGFVLALGIVAADGGQGNLDWLLTSLAMAAGAALIVINHWLARRKVRLGRCQLAAA